MNKFIEKIIVPKSFSNTRDCTPAGRDTTSTSMARLEKDMSAKDPILEPTEKMKLYNQSMNCWLTYDQKQDPEPVDLFPDPVVPVEPVFPKEDLEDDLAITLQTSLRSKSQHLYQKLKGTLQ